MFRNSKAAPCLFFLSVIWLLVIGFQSQLHSNTVSFGFSGTLLVINLGVALWHLSKRRKILIPLHLINIALFGMLNFQLYSASGSHHYQCDRDPQWYDWVEFTLAHVIRAADVLDCLDQQGIVIQNIMHQSVPSALLLLGMHLGVDIFLLSLFFHWLFGLSSIRRQTILEKGRKRLLRIVLGVFLFAFWALINHWKWPDWFLWPLENVLRLLDVGDSFQLFHWKIHQVDEGVLDKTIAILFRILVGIWVTRTALRFRLFWTKGWGLSFDELLTAWNDGDVQERHGVIYSLGSQALEPTKSIPLLIEALGDFDYEIRCEAAKVLGKFGTHAQPAVPFLAEVLWKNYRPLTISALVALKKLGPFAREALPDLELLTRIDDPKIQKLSTKAIEKIRRNPSPKWIEDRDPIQTLPPEKRETIKIQKVSKLPPERRMLKPFHSNQWGNQLALILLALGLGIGSCLMIYRVYSKAVEFSEKNVQGK